MNKESIKANLFIALQYLSAKKKQSFLAMLGVLFGVATFIVMVNFMTGVNDFLDSAVFEGSPDIIISSKPDTKSEIEDFDLDLMLHPLKEETKIKQIITSSKNVKQFAKQVITPAIFISKYVQLPGAINGVDPEVEEKLYDLDKRIVTGQGFKSLLSPYKIILGISLAKKLMVKEGDSLRIIIPNGNEQTMVVGGIFSFGITTIDNVRTYAPATTIQSLLDQNKLTTNIHIKLKDRNNTQLKKVLLNEIKTITVDDWKDSNRTIVAGNKVRDILTWSVSFALLLVAGFGIYNIMNNTVVQKRKDIAVLKTVGYTENDIVFIFITQALLIGVLGAIFGALIGYGISHAIAATPLQANDFIIVDTYPVNFKIIYYVLGILFGIITTLLAGYFPAKKASGIDPTEIIRSL